MLFICYPKCSTCAKARKWLNDNGFSYEERDISTSNPTAEELSLWYKASALPLKRFFNTSGKRYKELDLKNRIPEMSEDEQIRVLASDGMLVKRPLLIRDGLVLAGFSPDEWKTRLKDPEKL
jgi:arsenate reductase